MLRRYKRFLADVELTDGQVITAHTANTGAMSGCAEPGSRVWLSCSSNPNRKYAHTWELVEVSGANAKVLVGINTMKSNVLVKEAIASGRVNSLQGYKSIQTEVPYGSNSRIDLLLHGPVDSCYVEVKNVTLVQGRTAYFPDAVSKRAVKHLDELSNLVRQGGRGVLFFCVQRDDVDTVRPADFVDPDYARKLRTAVQCGVEALAYSAQVSVSQVVLCQELPVEV